MLCYRITILDDDRIDINKIKNSILRAFMIVTRIGHLFSQWL